MQPVLLGSRMRRMSFFVLLEMLSERTKEATLLYLMRGPELPPLLLLLLVMIAAVVVKKMML